MQETSSTTPLRVWPFTLAAASTAVVVGIMTIPIHILKHFAVKRFEFETPMGQNFPRVPGPGPGFPPPPPAGPMGPEMHGAWQMAHVGIGIEWIVIGLLVVAVYAGVAGAVFAAVYNAMATRRASAS